MTVNEILILVRQRLGDMQKVTFSDEELVHCLNDAMDDMCISMANSYEPEILKQITLVDTGVELPEDFIAWQGQFALSYQEGEDGKTYIYPLDSEWGGENDTLKYFAYKPHFTSMEDEIPFRTGTHCKRLMNLCIQQIKPSTGGGSGDSQGASNASSSAG